MKIGFGVDLGGTTVKLAAFSMEGKLLSKWEIPTVTENAGCKILPDIADSVLEYCGKKEIERENAAKLAEEEAKKNAPPTTNELLEQILNELKNK